MRFHRNFFRSRAIIFAHRNFTSRVQLPRKKLSLRQMIQRPASRQQVKLISLSHPRQNCWVTLICTDFGTFRQRKTSCHLNWEEETIRYEPRVQSCLFDCRIRSTFNCTSTTLLLTTDHSNHYRGRSFIGQKGKNQCQMILYPHSWSHSCSQSFLPYVIKGYLIKGCYSIINVNFFSRECHFWVWGTYGFGSGWVLSSCPHVVI